MVAKKEKGREVGKKGEGLRCFSELSGKDLSFMMGSMADMPRKQSA